MYNPMYNMYEAMYVRGYVAMMYVVYNMYHTEYQAGIDQTEGVRCSGEGGPEAVMLVPAMTRVIFWYR